MVILEITVVYHTILEITVVNLMYHMVHLFLV